MIHQLLSLIRGVRVRFTGVALGFSILFPAFAHALAPTMQASNLKLSVSGGTVVLQWNGTSGVLYQAESAPAVIGPCHAGGEPTTDSAVTNVIAAPSQMYRVAVFTNTTQYVANA